MKNSREYYRFDSVNWRERCKETLARKYSRSVKLALIGKEEIEAAKIGEPVKFILQLMKEDPRRFKTTFVQKSYVGDEASCATSVDKITGHKIAISRFTTHTPTLDRQVAFGEHYGEYQNPWLTKGEMRELYWGIRGIIKDIHDQDRKAKEIAQERRMETGRSRVMEMYKQEMK